MLFSWHRQEIVSGTCEHGPLATTVVMTKVQNNTSFRLAINGKVDEVVDDARRMRKASWFHWAAARFIHSKLSLCDAF